MLMHSSQAAEGNPLKRRSDLPGVELTWLDVLPLHYWLSTRIRTPVGLLTYALTTWAFLLAGLAAAGMGSVSQGCRLLALWVGYWGVYELGYMTNDFWSQSRELKAGYAVRKVCGTPRLALIGLAGLTRIALAAGLLLALSPGGWFRAGVLGPLLLAVSLVFFLHNLLLGRARMLTHVVLHLLRYMLIVVLRPDLDTLVIVLLIAIPPSLSATFCYVAVKGWYPPISELRPKTISTSMKLMTVLYCAEAVVSALAGFRSTAWTCVIVAGLGLLIDIGYIGLRVLRRLLASLAVTEMRFHVHTAFSHDGGWQAADIVRSMREDGVQTVFVTEHVEDMSPECYAEVQAACAHASQQGDEQLVAGVEYTLLGQHFLALGLDTFAIVAADSIDSIHVLQKHCRAVVWAHPRISLRRLATSPSYAVQLAHMGLAVDGIEWLNLKPSRSARSQWRFLAALLAATYLGGRCDACVGVDAHSLSDWQASGARLRALQALLRPLTWTSMRVLGQSSGPRMGLGITGACPGRPADAARSVAP